MAANGAREKTTADAGGLVPLLILSCAVNVALGLGLVLVSIERTELGYALRRLEGAAKTRGDLYGELEVERGRLLSPYVLEKKAAELGMRAAKQGQIRRMDGFSPETPPRGDEKRQ